MCALVHDERDRAPPRVPVRSPSLFSPIEERGLPRRWVAGEPGTVGPLEPGRNDQGCRFVADGLLPRVAEGDFDGVVQLHYAVPCVGGEDGIGAEGTCVTVLEAE